MKVHIAVAISQSYYLMDVFIFVLLGITQNREKSQIIVIFCNCSNLKKAKLLRKNLFMKPNKFKQLQNFACKHTHTKKKQIFIYIFSVLDTEKNIKASLMKSHRPQLLSPINYLFFLFLKKLNNCSKGKNKHT